MARIINARDVSDFKGRKILFDTNVWIFIEGLNGNSYKNRQDIYTSAWISLKKNNIIVVNEYVISEFCNRSIKMDYDFHKNLAEKPESFMSFKNFRKSELFKDIVEVVKDTCFNILEECEFCSCNDRHYNIKDAIEEFADAKMDLSDIIIRNHCQKENYILMSDDSDYAMCDIDLITANNKMLPARK